VLYDREAKLFKAWYSSHGQGASYLNYATSEDGYHWERPELAVVPGTNIVLDKEEHTHGPSILLDVDEPDASKRYKLIMNPGPRFGHGSGLWVYFSPDGIHWRMAQREPTLLARSDSHSALYRDQDTGLYQTTYRLYGADRRVWRSESEDMLHWTRPRLGIEPDVHDGDQTQIYGTQMTPYGNYVIGWMSMLNTEEWDRHYGKGQGTMDVQLAYSRDGYCWHRAAQGQRFIPRGLPGSWDAGMVLPSTTACLLDDEIRFFYAGTPYGHGGHRTPDEIGCMGTASLRPDGFMALHAGEGGGEFLSRQFAVHAPEIRVNADASQGEVLVEVCEGSSALPLKGFSFDDCVPLRADGIAQRVMWTSGADPSDVVGRPIRLRVRALRADIYSVSMPNGTESPAYWDFREITGRDPLYDLTLGDVF
jgi:hypothetical protein